MLNTNSSLTAEINRQQSLSRQIAQLQTDISTGIKVHVASDDPAAAAQIATIGRAQANQTVYAKNVSQAQAITSQVDSTLASVSTALTRVNELLVRAANPTTSAADRTAAATELTGLRSQIADYANTTDVSGNALFSKTAPLQIPIGDGVTVAAGDSYDTVFGSIKLKDGTTSSIDTILGDAITALQTNDTAGISTALDSATSANNNVSNAQTDVGVRETQLSNASDALADQKTDLTSERSGLEETDPTVAYSTLQSKMTTLDAAQTVLAQLSKISLFDKLG